ncbi:hypothetical protein [Streptomyces sp. NPDC014734]|uniref:hypothetical protein n=1 Tax=Streptomyces sp. NPDC014734 TaxID=3364886 RepID=UPI0037035538
MSRPGARADARAGVNSSTTPRFFDHPAPSRGDDAPPARSRVRATAEAYPARGPEERGALVGLPSVLDSDNPCSRAAPPGHITCGAVVIGRDRRVLHIGHRGTGLLLVPGDHVGDDRILLGWRISPPRSCPTPERPSTASVMAASAPRRAGERR